MSNLGEHSDRKPPRLRQHKATGRAFIMISGKSVYFGKHDSPEIIRRYRNAIFQWFLYGNLNPKQERILCVGDICKAYRKMVEPDLEQQEILDSIERLFYDQSACSVGEREVWLFLESCAHSRMAIEPARKYLSLFQNLFLFAEFLGMLWDGPYRKGVLEWPYLDDGLYSDITCSALKRERANTVKYSRSISPGKRFEILKRDGFKCVYCGAGANSGAKLQIDHIHPVAAGGGNEVANLATACSECNLGKAAKVLI